MHMFLTDKVVLLSGASAGIGRSLLFRLIEAGALVAFCGRSEQKMNDLYLEIGAEEMKKHFSGIFCLSKETEIVNFIRGTYEKFGRIDYLINCAGLNSARGNVEEIDTEDLDWMYKINLRAPMIMMKETSKIMKPFKQGTIINVLSTVCLFSNEGIGAYTASKSGLDALTKVFRKEVRKDHIKVISVYPGGVNTGFRDTVREDYLSPESVAETILKTMNLPAEVMLDEIVLRPAIERNF